MQVYRLMMNKFFVTIITSASALALSVYTTCIYAHKEAPYNHYFYAQLYKAENNIFVP